MLRKYRMKAIEKGCVGNEGLLSTIYLAVIKKKYEIFLYEKGSHVKSCFVILNMSL